jgi:hypothetical protein
LEFARLESSADELSSSLAVLAREIFCPQYLTKVALTGAPDELGNLLYFILFLALRVILSPEELDYDRLGSLAVSSLAREPQHL